MLTRLYQSGALAGRTYDVLMQRWPLAELQRQLDLAAQVHPQSETLADFRAPLSLIQAETDALAGAARWITPHRRVAALAGKRAVLLDWKLPKSLVRQIGCPLTNRRLSSPPQRLEEKERGKSGKSHEL